MKPLNYSDVVYQKNFNNDIKMVLGKMQYKGYNYTNQASLVTQLVKNPPAKFKT